MAGQGGARARDSAAHWDPGSHSDTSGGGARRRAIGHVEPRTWPARRIFDGTVVPISERARPGRANRGAAEAQNTSPGDRTRSRSKDGVVYDWFQNPRRWPRPARVLKPVID